ncbi:MAG: hypothetical protein MK291_13240 [Planctomycetes bacterium]|nr:hypothetical protein [Planctomycetota bacterium]
MNEPSIQSSRLAGVLIAMPLLVVLAFAVGQDGGVPGGQTAVPASPGGATADSNGSMIAVTGTDMTGAMVLYVIDTESKHLAVYQASAGAKSSQGIKLVAARRIGLDLELDGYNDKSEHSYKALRDMFGPAEQEDS